MRDNKLEKRYGEVAPLAYLPPMPISQLLIGMGDTQDCGLFKWFAHNLQTNGQTIGRGPVA